MRFELPRFSLFEVNDSPWAPAALKETEIEALSRTLERGRVLEKLVPAFSDFLLATGATEVLDLCSGAGGPAAIFSDEIKKSGRTPPRFLLTDLQPHVAAWEKVRRQHPDTIDFVAEPVDATKIPPGLGRGRPRVIINAFHHFGPELAGEILRGAARDSPGVFLAEGFGRNPLRFAPFVVSGAPALFATPIRTERRRAEKVFYTWLTPVAVVTSVWDGLVSTLRVYTERELREMVAPLGTAFRWTWGTYDYPWFGRGTYFYGVRT